LSGSSIPNTSTPWSSSNPNIATVSNIGVVTGISEGTTTITYINDNGCTATSTIVVNGLPAAGITNNSASATLHCNQTSINLTATGGGTYNWSNGLGTSASQTITTPGTYTVTVTAPNGCTDQESITIIQSPNPTVSVNPLTICSGSSGTLTAVASSAGGTFEWSLFPTGTVIPGNGSTINVTLSSNTIYNVHYIDTNGCESPTEQAAVSVLQTPTATLTGPNTLCSGNSANLVASTSLSGASGFYSWSPNSSTTSTASVSPITTTTYSVNYTLNGCQSNTATHTITVYQTPTVTVNNVGICTGGTGTLTATPSVSGGTYSWITTPVSTSQSITVQPDSTTSYSVTYTSTDNCPSSPATGTITVTDIPTIQLDDINVCEGQSGTLTAIPSASGGTYAWTPAGTSGNTFSITPTTSTSVSVVYTLNGCSSMPESANVTVLSIPSVSVSGLSLCQNQTGTLTAIPSVPGGTYLWSTTETTSSINVNPQTTTQYSVVYSYGGCPSNPAFVTVKVDPVPVITFDADVLEGCSPLQVNFTNTTVNSQNCVWNLGNGTIIDGCGSISYTFQQAGCYDISLKTDSPNGCSDTLIMNDMICVYPSPVANFTVSTNVIGGGNNTVYFDNISEGASDYIWYYGDNQVDNSVFNPEGHTYNDLIATQYVVSLVAISEKGCIDSTYQIIAVSDEIVIYAPNTFIPNGDGLNDVWLPVISGGLIENSYSLDIFNRWGELIFTTKDYTQGWDGTFKGDFVQNGTYTFKIRLRDSETRIYQYFVGHINLMR
jgi:gliding motility-associated-like protein